MIRITLDTNQLVRALMRPPELATFMMSWQSNRFRVVASHELLAEYERVLVYPDIRPLIFAELLRAYRSHLINLIEIVSLPMIAPVCRDPDDDKVVATAIYGRVAFLVSEDDDVKTPPVKRLLQQYGIQVISTEQLLAIVDSDNGQSNR